MKMVLLKNANVLDGTLNMEVKEGIDILIADGKIAKMEKDIDEPMAKVIDLNGAYVTPGLINLHVHLPASGKISKKKVADKSGLVSFITKNNLTKQIGVAICAKYAKTELLSGVTTVRCVGGVGDCDAMLKEKINKGKKDGPRLLVSNNAICTPGGHMQGTVSVPAKDNEEAIKLVDLQIKNKADWIKLMITGGILDTKERGKPGVLKMDASMVKACCDEAHAKGYRVCAHVEGPEGMKIAMENGVDTIEHGADFDEALIPDFKKRNGAIVCTLSPAIPLDKLSPSVTGYSEDVQYNTDVFMKSMIASTNKALKNGVPVGLGTDTACPFVTHYDMYRELIYFTKYIDNITNSFALHTATLVNATIARISDETGSVEINKSADLLIIKDNPLKDLKALADPLYVIYKGKVYTQKNKKFPDVEEALNSIL